VGRKRRHGSRMVRSEALLRPHHGSEMSGAASPSDGALAKQMSSVSRYLVPRIRASACRAECEPSPAAPSPGIATKCTNRCSCYTPRNCAIYYESTTWRTRSPTRTPLSTSTPPGHRSLCESVACCARGREWEQRGQGHDGGSGVKTQCTVYWDGGRRSLSLGECLA
jgi:hypothetical protein